VSPEKHARLLASENESAPFYVLPSLRVHAEAPATAHDARRPLRSRLPAQIRPFMHFVDINSSRINTSENFSISCISLIHHGFKSTRTNTSGNKDLKSLRINTSGSKDLKSFRINTSKKQGRGEGPPRIPNSSTKNCHQLVPHFPWCHQLVPPMCARLVTQIRSRLMTPSRARSVTQTAMRSQLVTHSRAQSVTHAGTWSRLVTQSEHEW
jgi:hypothetical protein